MLKTRLMKVLTSVALGAILVVSCGGGNVPEATPTAGVDQIQTAAVSTFSSSLTLTAIVAPTNTPAVTDTPVPTFAPLSTSTGAAPLTGGLTTPGVPVTSGGSTTNSCYGLTFVSDVTIPDNTQMQAGKKFTKTWKVQNSGSCAWDAGFKFQNTGGDSMGASAVTLPASVASGATSEVSVSMTAPSTSGTVRSNWRMSTGTGQFFGDEVYVQIVVGSGGATATSYP